MEEGARIPRSRGASYWLREALAAEGEGLPAPALAADTAADVVVVGGGYTGLWTAYLLTERAPGIDVVVLERGVCGEGASGRNGGFASGWWDDLPDLVERYGEGPALAACRAVDESVRAIGDFCRRHGVDAWFRPAGYLGVATSPAQDGLWSRATAAAARLGAGEEYREVTPEEVARVCSSPVFRGGVLTRTAATVQPARLARGLRRVLLERGARIHEGTPALRVRPGDPVEVETPHGRVRAGRAVLALNAWAASWPGFRRRLVVRGSYVLITAPAPERLEEIGWTGGQCITDFRVALSYFRTTPDGRIAFGKAGRKAGGSRVRPRYDYDPDEVNGVLRSFRRLFPSFEDVPVEEAWGGAVDLSPAHHPFFGTDGGGVLYGLGYTGNGVAPSHLAGRVLAALALDRDDGGVLGLPMVGAPPPRFPPEPLRSAGAALVQRAIARKERLEDEGRRPGPLTRLLAGLPRRLGYAYGHPD